MSKTFIVCSGSIYLLFSIQTKNFAQDSHYWTNQFGSRSSLLGGSVVGGVRDNSAVYYNPGALAFLDSANLSVNANAYQFDQLKIENGAGDKIDLNSNQTQIIPLMVSGLYKFKKNINHSLGYSIITRHQTSIRFSARKDTSLDIIDDHNYSFGNEEYIGQFNFSASLNEQLFGVCYAYRVNKRFALGLTNFVAYRTQNLDYSFTGRAIPPSDTSIYYLYVAPLLTMNDVVNIQFTNIRYIGKIGIALDFNWLKAGVTVTMPSFNIFGDAIIGRDYTLNNLNLDNVSLKDYLESLNLQYPAQVDSAIQSFKLQYFYSFTANDRQNKIKTTYKSPLSVAGGFELKLKRTKIALTAEWFDKVPVYDLATPKKHDFLRPKKWAIITGITSDKFLRIREGAKSVVNFAVGIEQEIGKNFSVLASFRTNNSYLQSDDSVSLGTLSITYWNLYHATLGIVIKKPKSDINVGLSYGFMIPTKSFPLVEMANPKETNYLGSSPDVNVESANISFNSYALLLGYTYYFK